MPPQTQQRTGQSSTNRGPPNTYVNLSQSQRINIQNYNQTVKQGMHKSELQTSHPDASRSQNNVQVPSNILKQSIKEFQDMVKYSSNHRNGLIMQKQMN